MTLFTLELFYGHQIDSQRWVEQVFFLDCLCKQGFQKKKKQGFLGFRLQWMPFRAYEKLPKWSKSTVVLTGVCSVTFAKLELKGTAAYTLLQWGAKEDKEERGRINTQQIPNAYSREVLLPITSQHDPWIYK